MQDISKMLGQNPGLPGQIQPNSQTPSVPTESENEENPLAKLNELSKEKPEKKKDSKTARWQAISESASKQSKRTIIPKVENPLSFAKALEFAKSLDMLLVPYEAKNGMQDTVDALEQITSGMKVGILIGPEGGFEESEIEKALDMGAKVISLGKRILRTETAAICATAMIMLHCETRL